MKSRSHRLPIAETHDDWVDGSWTVDCVCGVNFDDGEEMVNCDECGVWVHTRCSRYVKSEKSFACDKCKSKNCRNTDTEETEVAQLLVDLPNQTLRMDNLYPLNRPSHRPVQLYTQISTEKNVYVHGIPGGDPSLFAGLSSIFSPQLWKCTGYVPKKFNVQYKEFPSCDEKEEVQVESRNNEESDNAAENENTAGGLFSLLKYSPSGTPFGSSMGVKCLVEDGKAGKRVNSVHRKSAGEINAMEKDSSLPHAAVVDSMKHKKKESGTSKDRHERKRTGIHEKGKDFKKKASITSTTASTISSDGKQFEFYEDRGPKVIKVSTESRKSGESRHHASKDQLSNGPGIRGIHTDNDKKLAAADEYDVETNKLDSTRCYTNSDGRLIEDSSGDQGGSKIDNSQKGEVVSGTLDSPNVSGGGSAQRIMAEFQKAQPVVEHLAIASREVIDSKKIQGFVGDVVCYSETNAGVKTEVDKNLDVLNVHHFPSSKEKLQGLMKLSAQQVEVSALNLSENVKKSDLVISSSEISDQMPDGDKSTAGADYKKDGSRPGGSQSKPELPTGPGVRDSSSGYKSGSICSDGSFGDRKSLSQLKTGSKYVDGVCKLGARISSSDPNHLKVLVCKSSSKSCKSSTSGSQSPRNISSHSTSSKQRGMSNEKLSKRRDAGSPDAPKDEGRIERSKKIVKNTPESSISHASKITQSSRISHAPISKGNSSVPKESPLHSSSKKLAPSATAVPSFAESTNSLKNAGVSNAQNKVVGSGLPEKSERTSQHDSQPSSKVNASQMQPPVSSNHPSGLRDEDYALFLHQQLNSSPRVPRVPRIRHAGSLPQLTSPTTVSKLMKRTSSSGGKGFSSTSTSKKRRKSDADPSGAESEDNVRRERTAKEGRSKSFESQQEEFPKGKRKARKRRRLALPGRGIKDFRRRRRAEVVSDDEDGSLSNSSGDSESSKDEMQGDGTSGTNEASASSDETSN